MIRIPTLDKWVSFNDCLVGEALNHPEFENRQRVITNKVLMLDQVDGMVKCVLDEFWQLGSPGKIENYWDPLGKRFF